VSAAEASGATIHLDVRVSAAPVEGGARCSVLARTGTEAWAYTCDHVVDATGRSPLPFGPRRGRTVSDPLAAIVGFGPASCPSDGRTILEAAERGWWYCANLPDGRVVATFMTDPSLVGRDYARLFRDEVCKTAVTASYAARADEMTIGVVNCSSYLRSPVVMKRWVAVGDAASAYDPLSSLGICKALESGIRAADALATDRLDEYETWVRSSFEQYVRTRDAYYALETRWPDSPFWRARRGERA
jgi:flavin-dependent dehydrogenase